MFPSLGVYYILIEIGCIFPVTIVEAEQSFSVLRRLKTPVRSASLSLMYMNYDIPINPNDVVERFYK